ncbi:MAG: MerR family transcriptional regulator, partial [Bacteroidetes bacterium]|jgi:DNA-binding transcriptional MerR regulator|nr:MerR family transcriptional regulator [Bacteroidota bacterium]MBT4729434.1 MerR family transcriptional regulator [Bacteroidota bacterium]
MSDIFIFRGIDFELGFSDYTSSDESNSVSALLNKKTHKPAAGDFSYRIINHWESNDLLSSSRTNGKGWRRYSVMDLVWLYIIQDMRTFGISLDLIKKVKKNLIEVQSEEVSKFPLLEYYVSISMLNEAVYLLVFENGQAHPVTEKEYASNREFSSKNNHLQININNILQKIFTDKPIKAKSKEASDYSSGERMAIQLIRLGAVKQMNITLSNGSKQIVTKKEKEQFENIVSHIQKKKYNQIELSHSEAGMLVVENEESHTDGTTY